MGKMLISFWWLLAVVSPANAVDVLAPIPQLRALVTDQTATLSPAQRGGLEARLREFEARKGSQLAVLIVATTQPEAIEQYALRVAEQWKMGRKKVDDGVILVVAKSDRAVRIEVGYGLEGILNDATCKRVISETILPRFKQGDYFGGIDAGLDQMIKRVEGEALPAQTASHDSAPLDFGNLVPVLLVIAVVVGRALRAAFGRLTGATLAATLVGLITWFLSGVIVVALLGAGLGFIATLFGSSTGLLGAWYGGGTNRGGGGGFGGGGASGKW